MKRTLTILAIGMALVFALNAPAGAKTEFISIGTGGTGGVYYPYGGGVAELWSKSVPNVKAVAEVTGASVENIKLAHKGETVVGLTIVAAGTSLPEVATSVLASVRGQRDLAVGNVVGSNIANILLILGAAALVTPLAVESRIVKVDVPMILAASLGLWLLSLDGRLSHWDGALLFAVLVIYLIWSVRQGQGEADAVKQEFTGAVKTNATSGEAHGTVWTRPAGQLIKDHCCRFIFRGFNDLIQRTDAQHTQKSPRHPVTGTIGHSKVNVLVSPACASRSATSSRTVSTMATLWWSRLPRT